MAEEADPTTCRLVGEPMPDIAGIGIIIGFTGQAFLSLSLALWVFFFSRHGRLDLHHEDGSDEHIVETKRLEMVQDILMIGNDIQVMTGIALMISAFTGYRRIDLYHLRLIYDIVSFVGVSVTAALVCLSFCVARKEQYRQRRHRRATGLADEDEDGDGYGRHRRRQSLTHILRGWIDNLRKVLPSLYKLNRSNPIIEKAVLSTRYRITYLFSAFFLTLTILLNQKLGQWNPDKEPGFCYNSAYTSNPTAPHPQADRVYIWLTCTWLLSVMMFSVFDGSTHRRYILVVAFLQFPVHLYMMIAMRTANQGLLGEEGEAADESENDWDFGQTTAVLLFAVAVVEAISKGREFFRFEKNMKKKRAKSHRHGNHEGDGNSKTGGSEAALHTITNTTSESDQYSRSWLRPWKHESPSEQQLNNANEGNSIAMVNTAASPAAAINDVNRGHYTAIDVEAVNPPYTRY